MMKDTVAIVGSHPRTRNDFDFTRTDCDIWIFNEALSNGTMPRADAVFQMHAEEIWRNPENRNDKNHVAWLLSGDTPSIYMHEHYEDVPKSVRYPIEDLCNELLGDFNHQYFTSSPAYAIALACYHGYKTIEIFGVEMETNTEYSHQRPGVAFWIGVALGRGIRVEAHTQIFDDPLYGYNNKVTISYEEFITRRDELVEKCAAHLADYEKARDEINGVINHYALTGEEGNLLPLIKTQVALASKFGEMDGARQENDRYAKKIEGMKAIADGKYQIVRQEHEQTYAALGKEHWAKTVNATQLAGKLDLYYQSTKNVKNKTRRRERIAQFMQFYNIYIQEITRAAMMQGAMIENQNYLRQLDTLIKAAGGSKSEAVLIGAEVMA